MAEVWLILLDGFELYEASAVMHAFVLANEMLAMAGRRGRYRVRFFACEGARVRGNGEVAVEAQALPGTEVQPPDRLIVVGGMGAMRALTRLSDRDQHLIAWLAHLHPGVREFASVGEDAFVVLNAALSCSAAMIARHETDPSTATSSGMELALRMISQDQGPLVARQVAQRLAPSPDRIGAAFRFHSKLVLNAVGDERVRDLHRWIAAHLCERLTNDRLAHQLAMSPRTFARFYSRATGFTPARAVEQLRLEHACHNVETTLMSFKAIAQHSGFSSEEVMRRAFVRVLNLSPSEYKELFHGKV